MQKEIVTIRMIIRNDLEVIVDGYVIYYVDKRYGADADGNRAVKRTFVDDVVDIDAVDVLGNDVVLTARELEIASIKLIDRFFE